MSEKNEPFDVFVIRSILASNRFGITEVNNIKSLQSRYYIEEEYPQIKGLILSRNIKELKSLPDNKSDNGEYLEIMAFNDQTERLFIVTVFDSNELTQDPQVIEIFNL